VTAVQVLAVDTSALMAVVLGESHADQCIAALQSEGDILISAATVAEALIVAERRNVRDEMQRLIEGLGLTVVAVTAATAQRVARAYEQWGKGNHKAGLNFGDCFSYDIAKAHDCPLLYVGADFALTDVTSVV